MLKLMQTSAAWRISIWTTVAFACGTALAFSIVYFFVAKAIQDRSDAWLSGEADTLVRVSNSVPKDRLYKRVLGEVAEVATREVPDERNANGQRMNSVFFLANDPSNPDAPLWVGPGSGDVFLKAIHQSKLVSGVPQSIKVDGWPTTFRIVFRQENGRTVYLGLSDRGARLLLRSLTWRFLLLWTCTVLMGFLIAYMSARRTLLRVQSITDTVARIGTEDLGQRLPQPRNSDEISRLAGTFNHMLDRIQSSVIELRSVTDAVAHDLKSPVTSIRGSLESLLSSEPNEKWRDSVCDAIEGLDRLLNALNSTLDVAEAQAGAVQLDRNTENLSAIVRQLVDLYKPSIDERQHELVLELQDQVFVDADWSLLKRVLSNLIENEIAHLPPACEIHIRLRSEGGSAILEIEDNGPGFPPEIGKRAFDRFVRGKHSRGHGIGLAFVDAIVRAHGGTAKISSSAAGGAVVSLSLPATPFQLETQSPGLTSASVTHLT